VRAAVFATAQTEKEQIMSTKDQLELILDKSSLPVMLAALSMICYEKSEHVAANWQDESLASSWETAAAFLEGLVGNEAIANLP
jgi:hypothetical protein